MIGQSEPVLPFELNSNKDEEPSLTWKLLKYPGTYMGIIGIISAICICIYFFKRLWFRPATQRHQPYSPVSLPHAIVDDDIEAAPIYRSVGTVEKPLSTHEYHVLYIE